MDTTENLNELFYGKEASEKIEMFKNGMLEIEKRHLFYFEQRHKKYTTDEIDRLHNHYITHVNENGILLNFVEDSDLLEQIKNECIELFNQIFNSK